MAVGCHAAGLGNTSIYYRGPVDVVGNFDYFNDNTTCTPPAFYTGAIVQASDLHVAARLCVNLAQGPAQFIGANGYVGAPNDAYFCAPPGA
jgi:hypothetical protein